MGRAAGPAQHIPGEDCKGLDWVPKSHLQSYRAGRDFACQPQLLSPLGVYCGGTLGCLLCMGLLQRPTGARAPGRGRDLAWLETQGRARLPFIMGKNLLKCLIRD